MTAVAGMDSARALAFAPDGGRAEFLDLRMMGELASSLRHLAEAGDAPEVSEALTPVIARLEKGAMLPPLAFGLYYEIAEAMLAGAPRTALAAAERLRALSPRGGRTILARGTPEAAALCEQLQRRMGDEFDRCAGVAPEAKAGFEALFAEAMGLIARCAPTLAAELDHLLHQVLLVTEAPSVEGEFHGASHYQFWGLLMINPRHMKTALQLAETIAHECAHCLLFGLTIDETLVDNPDDELFASPLRDDLRPMDGIYHATFVSARMAWAMEMVATRLTGEDRARALEAAREDRQNFAEGHRVVAAHGQLSPTGAAIMAGAEAWIGAR